MAKKKKQEEQTENKLEDLKEAEQEVQDNERAELEAEHERIKAEAEEAEDAAANQVDDTGQAPENDEDAELAGQAQSEADAARDRIQEVEDDYGKGPFFDSRNIISKHGEWAVTHQGISHLYYEIHIAADLLNSYNKEHVEARYPYVNADEFETALKAAKKQHEDVEGGNRVYNPNPDFEDDYEPNIGDDTSDDK